MNLGNKKEPFGSVAVRAGFEPAIRVNVYTLSRRAPSATRTSHQKIAIFYLKSNLLQEIIFYYQNSFLIFPTVFDINPRYIPYL